MGTTLAGDTQKTKECSTTKLAKNARNNMVHAQTIKELQRKSTFLFDRTNLAKQKLACIRGPLFRVRFIYDKSSKFACGAEISLACGAPHPP